VNKRLVPISNSAANEPCVILRSPIQTRIRTKLQSVYRHRAEELMAFGPPNNSVRFLT